MKLRVSIIRELDYDEVYPTEEGDVITDREAINEDMRAISSGEWDLIQFLQETENEVSKIEFEILDEGAL